MKKYWKESDMNRNDVHMHQLLQLTALTWDGDLISKADRNALIAQGYARNVEGWNIITELGLRFLITKNMLKP